MKIRIKEFVSIGSDLLQRENPEKGTLKNHFSIISLFHYSKMLM